MRIIKAETTDGLILSGLLWEGKNQTDTIIIHIHGMAGDPYSNSFISQMAQDYPNGNIAFLSIETRGTHSITNFSTVEGKDRTIGNVYEIFEECVLDIQGWIEKAKRLGFKRILLQGHSLGCSKIAYYASTQTNEALGGLIFISPSDMLGLVADPEGRAYHEILLPEAVKLVGENKSNTILSQKLWSDYPLSAGTYLNLFGARANDAIFNYKKRDLGFKILNTIPFPVLAFTGTKDDGIIPVTSPQDAMETLERELKKSPKKKSVILEGAMHSFAGFEKEITSEVVKFVA